METLPEDVQTVVNKKKPLRYVFAWIATLPFDLLLWLVLLIFLPFIGGKFTWNNGLWLVLKPGKLFSKQISAWTTNYGGVTLAHGGFLSPGREGEDGIDTTTELHESVHVEQYEVAMLLGLMLAVVVFVGGLVSGNLLFGPAVAVWSASYFLLVVSGWAIAYLRGEDPYRGSQHEESAYSLVEKYLRDKGGSK